MMRRIFFMFPSARETQPAIESLKNSFGVPLQHLHVLAHTNVDLSDLPRANTSQRKGLLGLVAHIFWYSELGLFSAASAAFVFSLVWGSGILSAIALLVMTITFATGAYYAMRVPDIHLDEFHAALAHGEVLLMADVPAGQVADIESFIRHHHPAAIPGGASWTIEALGL